MCSGRVEESRNARPNYRHRPCRIDSVDSQASPYRGAGLDLDCYSQPSPGSVRIQQPPAPEPPNRVGNSDILCLSFRAKGLAGGEDRADFRGVYFMDNFGQRVVSGPGNVV